MRQTDAHMGRAAMGKWINIDDLPSGRVEWEDIFDAPSIDIVRCKECKHYFYDELNDCKMCYIHEYGEIWEDNDFCSYGEREGE